MAWNLEKVGQGDDWAALELTEAILFPLESQGHCPSGGSCLHPSNKEKLPGWRCGSAVESIEFSSQQPYDGSQPSLVESSALFWHKVIHIALIRKINKS